MKTSSRPLLLDQQVGCCCMGVDFTDNQAAAFTRNKVFTVYLEHGAKKSVLLNPMEPVVCNNKPIRAHLVKRSVLEKICISRGMNLQECVPEDMNGNVIPLNTKLGQIPSFEITFLKKGIDSPFRG